MTHFLVMQLRFIRHKWLEGLDGVSAEDAMTEVPPMNTISWMVGHLAAHERYIWVQVAQGRDDLEPQLENYIWGKERANPPFDETMAAWHHVTQAADAFLDTLDDETLLTKPQWRERQFSETYGNVLLRNIYHYWYHLGEMQSVRQMLGHTHLPGFVGRMPVEFQFTEDQH